MGSRYSQIGWSCYECKDKYPACHDTCETYQQARAERDAKLERIRKAKEKARVYDDYRYRKR
jgi:hypothetical protein